MPRWATPYPRSGQMLVHIYAAVGIKEIIYLEKNIEMGIAQLVYHLVQIYAGHKFNS
jgi:hypothetical protein